MNAVQLMAPGVGGPVDAEDFEPFARDRCNTWPLQKPAGDLGHNTSPLIHEEIPEEQDDDCYDLDGEADARLLEEVSTDSMMVNEGQQQISSQQCLNGNGKKNSSRRNAWGNLSYADLITQAILGSPDKRLTLSQIYDWMVHNVPYFRDKGDSNSSAGWKNSIRHNLSLHSRFMRIQNEGAGKSSWWMINPDAKHGKCSRRRTGSMEQSKVWEKKRGRMKKCLTDDYAPTNEQLQLSDDLSEVSSMYNSTNDLSYPDDFRCRVSSTLSTYSLSGRNNSSGRLSPVCNSDNWDLTELHAAPHSDDGRPSPYSSLVEQLPQSMKLELDTTPNNQTNGYKMPKLEYNPSPYSVGSCNGQSVVVKSELLDTYDDANNGAIFDQILEKVYYQNSTIPPHFVNNNNNNNSKSNPQIYRAMHPTPSAPSFYNYCSTNPYATSCANSEQLPSELSELHSDSYFRADAQWEVDQIIRQELTLNGKLDFNDLAHI